MIEQLAERIGASTSDIIGVSRKQEIATARELSWKFLREAGGYTLDRIARIFGRNHSTIYYGINRANNLLMSNDFLATSIWQKISSINPGVIFEKNNEFDEFMIIGFKKRFVSPILSGVKKHTIREDKFNRWSAGKKMNMATEIRTKNYNQFAEKQCTGTQKIQIRYYDRDKFVRISVDDHFLGFVNFEGADISCSTSKIEDLAKNDGFENIREFFEWFNTDFDGKIIHWTDIRY